MKITAIITEIIFLSQFFFFQCGTKGHYANKCPKGHLAFLALNQQRESGLDADSINTRDNMG